MTIPAKASIVNATLNIRCSVHPRLFNIPPHEHGTYGLNVKMKAMYKVNISINVYERNSPIILYLGSNKIKEINISDDGTNHETQSTYLIINGDFPICALNLSNSISLFTAAYTNNRISSIQVTSSKSDLDGIIFFMVKAVLCRRLLMGSIIARSENRANNRVPTK